MKKILVAAVGCQDPWERTGVGQLEWAGPIVRAVRGGAYDRVFLFADPPSRSRAEATAAHVRREQPAASVDLVLCPCWSEVAVAGLGGGADPAVAEIFHAAGGGHGVSVLAFPDDPWVEARLIGFVSSHSASFRVMTVESSGWLPTEVRPMYPAGPSADRRGDDTHPSGAVREPAATYGHQRDRDGGRLARDPPSTTANEHRVEAAERRLQVIAGHPSMEGIREIVAAVSGHQVPVLIQGDTGTGKGMVARLIHEAGDASAGPFVAVNCGALPATLIESQLFGHLRGAFTGATRDQPGKFVQADGGTLFLDEVGELPIELQPKLLRVLEDSMVEPIGAAAAIRVNLRIVAATNRDLGRAVAEGQFRKDLYYRLAFAVLRVPALRDRQSDIAPLALHFLGRMNRSLRSPRRLSVEALKRLERYAWPGNVRELENVIGRSALYCGDSEIGVEDLVFDEALEPDDGECRLPDPRPGFDLHTFLNEVRQKMALRALELAEGNQREAAKLLGLSPQGINRILRSRAAKPDG